MLLKANRIPDSISVAPCEVGNVSCFDAALVATIDGPCSGAAAGLDFVSFFSDFFDDFFFGSSSFPFFLPPPPFCFSLKPNNF